MAAHYFNTHPGDGADLRIEHRAGKTEGWNTVTQHAAGLGQGLKDGDRIAAPRQLEGAAQSGGSGADHGHLSGHGHGTQLFMLKALSYAVIADPPLECGDVDPLPFLFRTVAGSFAGEGTDSTAARRERGRLAGLMPGQFEGFLPTPLLQLGLLDRGQPGADVVAGRTGRSAGRGLPDIDGALVTMIAKGDNPIHPRFFAERRILPVQDGIEDFLRLSVRIFHPGPPGGKRFRSEYAPIG